MSENTPTLPYAGTSGHSGSEASRARAERADKNGTTSQRQIKTMKALSVRKSKGLTWKELDETTGWNHHGVTTGVLSVLHKAGKIARLKEQRNGCSVYVLPEWVKDRPTAAHGRNVQNCTLCASWEAMYIDAEERIADLKRQLRTAKALQD